MSSEQTKQGLSDAREILKGLQEKLGEEYDPTALEQIQVQQQRIGSLRIRLAEEEAAEAQAAAQAATPAGQEAEDADATVTLLSGGKNDRTLRVPAGTKLGDVLSELGWNTDGYSFKLRTGAGSYQLLLNGRQYVLAAGQHEIALAPPVDAGS